MIQMKQCKCLPKSRIGQADCHVELNPAVILPQVMEEMQGPSPQERHLVPAVQVMLSLVTGTHCCLSFGLLLNSTCSAYGKSANLKRATQNKIFPFRI